MRFDEHRVVAHIEKVSLKELRLWVRRGWVRPAHGNAGPVFDEVDMARIRLLCDLRKEMSLSNEALPVILTLIDRLHQTRRAFRALSGAIEEQPEELRRAIVARARDLQGGSEEVDTTSQET